MKNKPVRVTPRTAAKWLTLNKSNRPLSAITVNRYSAAMEAGEWKINGDSIRFDENGDLIDGQHRLHACVKSGKPFETYVVTDLPAEAFDTIDQGQPRTMAHVLARRGEKHYATLASAVRYVWLIKGGTPNGQGKLTHYVLTEILEAHPGIRDSVQAAVDYKSGKVNLISYSQMAALHYLFGSLKPIKNKEFWERVMNGEDVKKDMPEYWLRKRLIDNLGAQAKLTWVAVLAICIKAWNAASLNKEIKVLKWQDSEDFPKIQGLAYDNDKPATVKIKTA